jgi:hypothetical protein
MHESLQTFVHAMATRGRNVRSNATLSMWLYCIRSTFNSMKSSGGGHKRTATFYFPFDREINFGSTHEFVARSNSTASLAIAALSAFVKKLYTDPFICLPFF